MASHPCYQPTYPPTTTFLFSVCLEEEDSGCQCCPAHLSLSPQHKFVRAQELRQSCHPVMALPMQTPKWSQRLWCLPVSHSSAIAAQPQEAEEARTQRQQEGLPRAALLIPAAERFLQGRW